MKFQIMSDIHDEFLSPERSYLHNAPDSNIDALLLAGDILVPACKDRLANSWLTHNKPTYYILGNHEYYRGDWDESLNDYKEFFKANDPNIYVLEDEIKHVGNVRIIACTLWTDFWVPTPTGNDYHGRNCLCGMADFIVIRGLTVASWIERHKRSLAFIKLMLSTRHNGPTIVMTHHAPSFKSSHPKYNGSQISGGFCSDLDYVIEEYQPEYWIHGHCHESFNYNIGNTKIICNPRGYEGIHLNPDFNENLIIEL